MSGGRAGRVLVTGSSGLIGSHVVQALLQAGYRPRGFSRRPPAQPPPDVEHVTGDVRDPQALARALRGCCAAIHTAAVYSYSRADLPAMMSGNVAGTANVLDAAARTGVDRVVVTSSSATCGPVAGRAADEHDAPPVWELAVPYKRSKLAAERAALARAWNGQDIAVAVRALILSAQVGESHVAMARSLAADLRRRDPAASVLMRNDFGVLGAPLGRLLGGGYQFHLGTVTWSYNITYRLFTGLGVARRLGELALYALGGRPWPAVTEQDPDVVVTTHPVITTVAGRLRAAGRLRCPVAAVVGPLGGLAFWVHPGVDLHLLIYPESLPDVERNSGTSATVAVRPLVREEFFSAPTQAGARAQLGLEAHHPLVLISAGGWGAGDLLGAVDACLAVPDVRVVTVAGRNEHVRRSLEQRHGGEQRVTVLGFTDQMVEWLSAADAFVTTTAGLSCLEAQLCGCPTVCYGSAIGHVRDNTEALARMGLARAAATPAALTAELTAALAAGRRAACAPRMRSLSVCPRPRRSEQQRQAGDRSPIRGTLRPPRQRALSPRSG